MLGFFAAFSRATFFRLRHRLAWSKMQPFKANEPLTKLSVLQKGSFYWEQTKRRRYFSSLFAAATSFPCHIIPSDNFSKPPLENLFRTHLLLVWLLFSFILSWNTLFYLSPGLCANSGSLEKITTTMNPCPRGDGIMDSVLACGAGEPGSIPALSKWFFSQV